MHRATFTNYYMENTVVCGRTNVCGKYGRYKPLQDIGTDIVCKAQSRIIYDDDIKHVY